jgi:hypothetical protein
MPLYSLHFFQLLNVRCFGPLKALYRKQIKQIIQIRITYITKNNFLAAFLTAFNTAIIAKNIQVSFRAIGLVLYNLALVVNCLNPKSNTLLLLISCLGTLNF